MSKQPKVWHYGLVARWWAEFKHEGPEIAYFQQQIHTWGQPALDIGCGTGRLLLPNLQAGLQVDGCDISADMLALCRQQASQAGFTPALYRQAMHELSLPGDYRTIYICGSFGLSGDRDLDLVALERIYQHLEPGGALVFDKDVPYAFPEAWTYWTAAGQSQLPEAWPTQVGRRTASDGTDFEMRVRHLDINPLDQTATLQIRVENYQDDQLLAAEEDTLVTCLYFKNEIELMLRCVGFVDIQVFRAYSDQPPAATDDNLVFLARKKA